MAWLFPTTHRATGSPVTIAHRSAADSILFSILLLASLTTPAASRADQWTDVTGAQTMEAELLGAWGNQLIFLRSDGRRTAVSPNQLQAESRIRAQNVLRQREQQRAERIAELAQAAQAELAPAPAELPAPPEAPAYEPLPEGADLQQTVEHVNAQLQNGHVRVLWDALPAKYQGDLESLVVQFAGKMDPQLWQTQMASVRRVLDLLASRQNWILSHPFVAVVAAQSDDAPQKIYAPLLGIAQELADPQTVSLQRLQKGDLAQLIAERDEAMAGHFYQLQKISESLGMPQPQFEVKMIDKTRGTVTQHLPAAAAAASAPGQPQPGQQPSRFPALPPPQPEPYVLVDGRWVPEAIAKDWDARIAAAKDRIDALPESMESYRSAIASLVRAIDQYLAPLENAETREQFHAEMNELASNLSAAILPMFAGGGPSLPGRNSQQPGPSEPSSDSDPSIGSGSPLGSGSPMDSGSPTESDSSIGSGSPM